MHRGHRQGKPRLAHCASTAARAASVTVGRSLATKTVSCWMHPLRSINGVAAVERMKPGGVPSRGSSHRPAFLVHDIHAEINIEYAKIARPPVYRRGIGPLTSVAGSIRRNRRLDGKAKRGESHSPRSDPPAGRARAEGEGRSITGREAGETRTGKI